MTLAGEPDDRRRARSTKSRVTLTNLSGRREFGLADMTAQPLSLSCSSSPGCSRGRWAAYNSRAEPPCWTTGPAAPAGWRTTSQPSCVMSRCFADRAWTSVWIDGRARQSCVLNKGVDPTDRLADDTSATPADHHPLIQALPPGNRAKHLTQNRAPAS